MYTWIVDNWPINFIGLKCYISQKKSITQWKPPADTIAHFIIDCSSKSQVVIFNLHFNVIRGSLLLSP